MSEIVHTATVSCPEARARNLRAAIVFRGERDECLVREDALEERLAVVPIPPPVRDCHPVSPSDGPVPVFLVLGGLVIGALGAAVTILALQ